MAAEALVNFVSTHPVLRSDIIVRAKIWQCSPEILQESRVLVRDRDTRGTALPNSHRPNGIETKRCDCIPFGSGHRTQINRFSCLLAKF